MENEAKLVVRLPEDLLAAVKVKASKNDLTVSALIRKFFLAYVANEGEVLCEASNAIYSYKEIANRKRELKEAVKKAHEAFNEAQRDSSGDFINKKTKESIFVESARTSWKRAVYEYKAFCEECERNKNQSKEN